MKTTLALLFLVAICVQVALGIRTEQEYQDSFLDFMQQYGRSYHHDEFRVRYNIFKKNLDFIEDWNTKGYHEVAMNKFGDLSLQEFSSYYTGFNMPESGTLDGPTFVSDVDLVGLPVSFNWNDHGAVTRVKDQGQCGSCYTFSTTGSTEGCHFIKNSALIGLSEQNLMDCTSSYGNQGCNGGLMTNAMQYIIDKGGVDTESSYPYTGMPSSCLFRSSNIGASLTGFHNIPQGDEVSLLQAISQGPTSVAIDASHSSFQFYSSGVYNEPSCSSQSLDHAVLAVGWGISGNNYYYVVKNSWGPTWGLGGFIWMSRNNNNNCGIATMATIPKC